METNYDSIFWQQNIPHAQASDGDSEALLLDPSWSVFDTNALPSQSLPLLESDLTAIVPSFPFNTNISDNDISISPFLAHESGPIAQQTSDCTFLGTQSSPSCVDLDQIEASGDILPFQYFALNNGDTTLPIFRESSYQNSKPDNPTPSRLNEHAVRLCMLWLHSYPDTYPESKHIEALSVLTGTPCNSIKQWFGSQLRSPRSSSDDSAYLSISTTSMLSSSHHTFFSETGERNTPDSTSFGLAEEEPYNTPTSFSMALSMPIPSLQYSSFSVTETSVRGTPTSNEEQCHQTTREKTTIKSCARKSVLGKNCKETNNIALLSRNESRPFQCTRKCGKSFQKKKDWKRHEEIRFPRHGWQCTLGAEVNVGGKKLCAYCPSERPTVNPTPEHLERFHKQSLKRCQLRENNQCEGAFYRLQHFYQHFSKVHPGLNPTDYSHSSYFKVENGAFPKHCGFCSRQFKSWRERIDHVAKHFADDMVDMLQWREATSIADPISKDQNYNFDSDDSDYSKEADHYYENSLKNEPHKRSNTEPSSNNSAYKSTKISCRETYNIFLLQGQDAFNFQNLLESIRLLGSGGFGVCDEVVYRPTQQRFARKVFLSSPHSFHHFSNEVTALLRLRHPHITQFIGAYNWSSTNVLLISPVADGTLAQLLVCPPHTKAQSRQLVNNLGCLVSAVDYLHNCAGHGVIGCHMDIKPENVLIISPNQKLVLCDFGTANFAQKDQCAQTRTVTRMYAAPEVWNKASIITPKADIWSLGCVFSEALAWSANRYQEFRRFQKSTFTLDGSYRGNIHHVFQWFRKLSLDFSIQDAVKLEVVQSMMNMDPLKRPPTLDIVAAFPFQSCCFQKPDIFTIEQKDVAPMSFGLSDMIQSNSPKNKIRGFKARRKSDIFSMQSETPSDHIWRSKRNSLSIFSLTP